MSSLRNAVKRITHKERSQPQSRAKLGILEKKKDYKERSKDYHRKRDVLDRMKQKASMKNPDEFYFGMHNAVVSRDTGKHEKTREKVQREFDEEIGIDTIRLMKDQDLSYVRMQKQREMKKVEKLRASLHFIDVDDGDDKDNGRNRRPKHTIFHESPKDTDKLDAVEQFDTVPELADRAFNRPRKSDLLASAMKMTGNDDDDDDPQQLTKSDLQRMAIDRKTAKKIAKARKASYDELEARKKRINKLSRAEAHLVTEKMVASKGRKRKIQPAQNGQPAQYKWRRKRLS